MDEQERYRFMHPDDDARRPTAEPFPLLRWLVRILFASVALTLLARGCGLIAFRDDSGVSMDRAMQVGSGMLQADVEALLGKPTLTVGDANAAAAKVLPGFAPMAAPGRDAWTYNVAGGGKLMLGFGAGRVDYIDLTDGTGRTITHVGPTL